MPPELSKPAVFAAILAAPLYIMKFATSWMAMQAAKHKRAAAKELASPQASTQPEAVAPNPTALSTHSQIQRVRHWTGLALVLWSVLTIPVAAWALWSIAVSGAPLTTGVAALLVALGVMLNAAFSVSVR